MLYHDVCKNCASPLAWLQTISIHRRRRIIKIILELENIGHFVSLDYKVGVIIIVHLKTSLHFVFQYQIMNRKLTLQLKKNNLWKYLDNEAIDK